MPIVNNQQSKKKAEHRKLKESRVQGSVRTTVLLTSSDTTILQQVLFSIDMDPIKIISSNYFNRD